VDRFHVVPFREEILRQQTAQKKQGNEEGTDSEYLKKEEKDTVQGVDEELVDINASLAKQISEELDKTGDKGSSMKRKKKPRWLKILNSVMIIMLVLVGTGLFLGFTKPGNKLLMKMGVNLGGNIWAAMTNDFEKEASAAPDEDFLDQEDLNSKAPEVDLSQITWPDHPGDGRHEDGVYNILLLGEEAIGSGSSRGRTDVIVIATLNTNSKSIKLTSLMRDTLVQIPGYKDNKLNSAYEKGGIDLLYETIALNFDIKLDGCVKVNFENFQKIIDKLGGIDITLKQNEVDYLNTTNYISDPKNRTLVVGVNHMNGNQALGYARVRKTSTITGNNNDYGRTDRHRIILNAIFEKYKTKSKVDLASLMLSILPMITTDIDQKTFEAMLNTFFDMGTMNIEQLRIPADGTFTDNVRVRGMDALIPDLKANIDILHNFIFDDNPQVTAAAAE
jgi:LCP family protein required for cell wall assembly